MRQEVSKIVMQSFDGAAIQRLIIVFAVENVKMLESVFSDSHTLAINHDLKFVFPPVERADRVDYTKKQQRSRVPEAAVALIISP
jgi:hypothetical protein